MKKVRIAKGFMDQKANQNNGGKKGKKINAGGRKTGLSYLDIYGTSRTTMRLKWTFGVVLGQFGRLFDLFGASGPFSQSFPTIFSHNWLIEKNV